jgi:NTP pyrophosphatase (non-canonical NTP hydrolase)
MTNQIDLNKYKEFVTAVTSSESNNSDAMVERIRSLESISIVNGIPINASLLLTGAIGIASEGGEFAEIVKKIIFQGKPYDEATRIHMAKELSDICWYIVNAARSIGYNLDEIIEMNVDKLKSRYPGGVFDVYQSENRKAGDI